MLLLLLLLLRHNGVGCYLRRHAVSTRPGSLLLWLLDNSRVRQLADWTTRGCHRRLCVLSFRFLAIY